MHTKHWGGGEMEEKKIRCKKPGKNDNFRNVKNRKRVSQRNPFFLCSPAPPPILLRPLKTTCWNNASTPAPSFWNKCWRVGMVDEWIIWRWKCRGFLLVLIFLLSFFHCYLVFFFFFTSSLLIRTAGVEENRMAAGREDEGGRCARSEL